MSTQNSLEILLAWLKGNVEMETDIIFADDIDSAAMIPAVQSAIAGLKFDVFNDEVSNLLKVKHKQVVKDALDASSDFLDADCVMDRLGISYSDAELRLPVLWSCITLFSDGHQNDRNSPMPGS
jgi:hypothetical protein